LSYWPASGTAGSGMMRRPMNIGPDAWPAGKVTLKPAGDEKSRPVASAVRSLRVNVASTWEELSKRLLGASSTWTWKLPGSAASAPRGWGAVTLAAAAAPAAPWPPRVRREPPGGGGGGGAAGSGPPGGVSGRVVPRGGPRRVLWGLFLWWGPRRPQIKKTPAV